MEFKRARLKFEKKMYGRIYMRVRNWCFTAWNDNFLSSNEELIQYLGYGIEVCPKTGKTHYQGYVEFKKAFTLSRVKDIFNDNTVHLECRKGTQEQAVQYCMKDNEFFEFGELKKQGKRNDLQTMREEIEHGADIASIVRTVTSFQALRGAELLLKYCENPRAIQDINVFWCYGDTGSGKSHYAYQNHPDLFRPISEKWWEGYDGHDCILIDDIRGHFCTYDRLLQLCDKYPFRVETKGGSRQAKYTNIYITCPWNVQKFCEKFYDRSDRFEQLYRRITKQFYFEKEIDCPVEETYVYRCTEVGVGNTDHPDSD